MKEIIDILHDTELNTEIKNSIRVTSDTYAFVLT